MLKKIILRDLEKPVEKDLEEDIDWICESLGFYEKIDREKTASAIFRKLVESMADGVKLTSSRLGEESRVSRAAALSHLKKMMCSGLVVRDGNTYCMRCSSMYQTINEIHRDVDRVFTDLEDIAREVDERRGIKIRR